MSKFQGAISQVIKAQTSVMPFNDGDMDRFRSADVEDEGAQIEVTSPTEEGPKMRIPSKHVQQNFQNFVRKIADNQSTMQKVDLRSISERLLYPSSDKGMVVQKIPILGGQPISQDMAIGLRILVFGRSDEVGSVENEWLGQSFCFNEAEGPLGWALKTQRSGVKGIVMCVQGYILKHLLFSRKNLKLSSEAKLNLLKATSKQQTEMFVNALSDILWKIGEKQKAYLCLSQDNTYVLDSTDYAVDGVTEKIHIFEFKKQDELTFNLKKYLFEFFSDSDGNGYLLFLYSLILSRGCERIREDLSEDICSLVMSHGAIHPCVVTLMLTGRASLYLHNGIVYEGDESSMGQQKTGILTRAEIGFLCWREGERNNTVGSRLKTPSHPVWVIRCNDSFGILFNPNKDLMRDYHAENRFEVLYYSCHPNYSSPTKLTIDTRYSNTYEDYSIPPLDSLLHTKWQGAAIDWNGEEPYL